MVRFFPRNNDEPKTTNDIRKRTALKFNMVILIIVIISFGHTSILQSTNCYNYFKRNL